MKRSKKAASRVPPVFEADSETVYTLEVIGGLAGISSRTVLQYQEHGLISPVASAGRRRYNEDALRTVRRIEHLRTRYEMSLGALKLALRLLDELEQLRLDLRAQSRSRRPR